MTNNPFPFSPDMNRPPLDNYELAKSDIPSCKNCGHCVTWNTMGHIQCTKVKSKLDATPCNLWKTSRIP